MATKKEQLVQIECFVNIPEGSELDKFLDKHHDASVNLNIDNATGKVYFEVVNYQFGEDHVKILSKTKFELDGTRLSASKFKSAQAKVAAKGNKSPVKSATKGKGSR